MKMMSWSFLIVLALNGIVEAKLLRSAGLYYTPDEQIEIDSLLTYQTTERVSRAYEAKSAFSTIGVRLEHGLTQKISLGSTLNYGMGAKETRTLNSTRTLFKEDFQGLLDPEIYLKSHFETENFRFHANGIITIKGDSLILNYDRSPINFASGGTSLALLIGGELGLGPTVLGLDVRGDLWKDSQEVVEKSATDVDTLFWREGGKALSISVFAELSSLRSFKPGLRLRAGRLEESRTTLQNQTSASPTTLGPYILPQEDQLGASLYGRVRLPAHFVLNYELFTLDSSYSLAGLEKHNKSYGVLANIGYKF